MDILNVTRTDAFFTFLFFNKDVVFTGTHQRMTSKPKSGEKKNEMVPVTSGITPTTNTTATVATSKQHITMETKRSASPDPDAEIKVIILIQLFNCYFCVCSSLFLLYVGEGNSVVLAAGRIKCYLDNVVVLSRAVGLSLASHIANRTDQS